MGVENLLSLLAAMPSNFIPAFPLGRESRSVQESSSSCGEPQFAQALTELSNFPMLHLYLGEEIGVYTSFETFSVKTG